MGNEGDMVLVWNIVSRNVPNRVFSNLGKKIDEYLPYKNGSFPGGLGSFNRATANKSFFHIGCNWYMAWLRWNGIQRKLEARMDMVTSMDAQCLNDSSRTYLK